MIGALRTGLLVGAFIALFFLLMNLLPRAEGTWAFPEEISNSIQLIVNQMYTLDYLFPVDTMFQVLALGLGFQGIVFLYRVFRWILRLTSNLV